MNKRAWASFSREREWYKAWIEDLRRNLPGLGEIQQRLVNRRSGPAYTVQTPIVYNEALDAVTPEDDIRLILAADNPGRREQAEENRRYLVGPAGKLADKFFRENPGLGIDFRRNVLILNKTPIHTPRTAELAELCRLGGGIITEAASSSQEAMARLLSAFHEALAPIPVWITGYSEMRPGGVFETYTETLRSLYKRRPKRRTELFFYRHFSMNQFTIDLRQKTLPGESTGEALIRIGAAYRKRILENE
ncbi:MAG: hypothetical protein LBE17_07580 [Treponema sp.]|jgi:hypothetical protein|nr:hypothetical protein [Treponema sp.]